MSSHADSKQVPDARPPVEDANKDQQGRTAELDPADFDARTAAARKSPHLDQPVAGVPAEVGGPALEATASAIGVQDVEDAAGDVGNRVIDAAREGVFGFGLDDAARAGEDAGRAANDVLREIDSARREVFDQIEDVAMGGIVDAMEGAESAPDRIQDFVETLDQNAIPNEIYGRAVPRVAEAYEHAREQLEDAPENIERELTNAFLSAPEEIQRGFIEIGRVEVQAMEGAQDLVYAAQDAAGGAIDAAQDAADAAQDAGEAIGDAAEDAGEAIGDAAEDAGEAIEDAGEALNPFD
jgi:hypothetical protein